MGVLYIALAFHENLLFYFPSKVINILIDAGSCGLKAAAAVLTHQLEGCQCKSELKCTCYLVPCIFSACVHVCYYCEFVSGLFVSYE